MILFFCAFYLKKIDSKDYSTTVFTSNYLLLTKRKLQVRLGWRLGVSYIKIQHYCGIENLESLLKNPKIGCSASFKQ